MFASRPIVASALESPVHVGFSGDPALHRRSDAQRAPGRAPIGLRRDGDGVLEAGVQVRSPQVDVSRARFRTYLRTCLDGFVANARKADARLKRGGGVTLIPIDFDEAERELRLQAANAIDDFDAYFHREWLRGLFAAAATKLREACAERGRTHRFAIFEQYDLATDESERPTYAEIARRLGVSPAAVTNELAAARREFRRFVLDALRDQCASDEEFEAESRTLTG